MLRVFLPLLLPLALLVLPIKNAQSQDIIWTGAVSTDWYEAANWNPQTVPNSNSNVRINSNQNNRYPILTNSVKVNYFKLNGGQINIGLHTFEAEGMDTIGGIIITNNGKLKVTGINPLYSSYISGPIVIEVEYGRLFGITYDGDVTMHITSKTNDFSWWPRNSGVYISYSANDVFKGKVKFIVDGVGDLNIGTYATTTTFEKKVDFILSNPGPKQTRVYFSQRGGTSIFKDSVNIFLTPRTEFRPKSFVNFEGVVSINNNAGIFEVMQYGDFTYNPFGDAKSSLIHFRKDIVINQTGGIINFGNNYTSNYYGFLSASSSGSVIDTLSTVVLNGVGLTKGNINFINTTVNSPNTELMAVSHPSMPNSGTGISLVNSIIHGSIHIKADDIKADRTIFNGRTILNKDGYSEQPDSPGGNTFNKPVEFINSAGYDWNLGVNYPNLYKDSVRISLSGTGQHLIAGSNRGAFFKVGMVNGNRFEGPVRIETGTVHSGDIHIGSYGSTEFLDGVDISNFKSGGWLTFFNSNFRGADLGRTMNNSSPSMRLLFKNNCLFEGPVSIKVPRFGSDYTTFMKPVVIWKTDEVNDDSIGGNVFHQRVQFKNTSANGKIFLLSGEDKLIDKVPQ